MSFEGIRRRRCIVQKLDFENCIVTNIKTAARGRKKLRARITREFEHFTDIPERSCEESPNSSPTLIPTARASSPVLDIKHYRKAGSPVFKRKKANPPEEENEKLSEHSTIQDASSPPASPVFKTIKKNKTANVLDRTTNMDLLNSQRSSSSGLPSSFQIEEFTQESKVSVKISSVESPVVKMDTSNSFSGEADPFKTRESPTSNRFNILGNFESPKPTRRNYKKNSLLSRLHKLHQKQASEKLLWQHQNRKNSSKSLRVSIIAFWKEEFNYFIKCQLPDFETTFLVIDSRWVPSVKNIKEGSVLQVHPPWQKLSTEGSAMNVLLSVICLDVLDETKEVNLPEKRFEVLPADLFEANRKLFIDSLFSSCGSGFIY